MAHTRTSLMTGAGRIERYVFPLIYLLLRRHLKVMTLACNHVLDTEEFVTLNDSLVSILLAIDYRIQNVEAIFKQTHLDVQSRLGNFAFGIFQLSYGDIRRVPADNSFASWTSSEADAAIGPKIQLSWEEAKSIASGIPHGILKYGIKDGYSVTNYYEFEDLASDQDSSSIEGTWTGLSPRQFGDEWISCVLRVSIRLSGAFKIVGKGEDFTGAFEFSGAITSVQESSLTFKFVVLDEKDGTLRTCTGTLDKACATITAQWKTMRRDDSGDDDRDVPFTLKRTPPTLLRYRYTQHQFAEDPVRSQWSFACEAARHQAQEALWSCQFFEARFAERKRYVELTTRALIVQMGLTPQIPLTPVEKGELEYLRQELNPSEARFYQALAEFEIQKLPWHPAWGCDWCERQITKCRILCIQCISDDLSDNIDLCASCVDRAPTKRTFTHEASHAVVKVEQTLHDYDIVRVVEGARAIFERAKTTFRSLESAHLRPDDERHLTSYEGHHSSPTCACCEKDVLPPCWACVVCTKDTFVCADCDSKRVLSQTPGHTLAHALVRIRDTSVNGESATADDRLLALEQRLLTMEFKVAEGFAAMENSADERYAALEAKVEERLVALETRLEGRLSTLEVVLRQIAAQTAALPAVYGQVIRDYGKSTSIRKH
ncbi:hypothetical protein FPV67DRAFT_1413425 [Lyophyllum atratum]|nr:hypothetical protein FPV67DRAFT_1413425 [Lyophyllum atratum]